MKNLIGFLLLASGLAYADIRLGTPDYNGTGCPVGSAAATLSPDQRSLSILFDSMVAEAGGATGRTIDRKNCNITVPVHIPQGLSVSVFNIDYRGYNFLPARARSTFEVEYFFAGQRGPKFIQNFSGRLDSEYLIPNRLAAEALIWSPCGREVNLRANTSIRVINSDRRTEALSTLDSADIDAGLVYHLQWRRC